MKTLFLAAAAAAFAWAQPPEISKIMALVADNQAKSQELRKSYVYNQKQTLRMMRGGGKVAREEHREYVITPNDRGVHKELASFDGKYQKGRKYVSYDQPGYKYKDMDIDGSIIDSLSKDLTDDKKSKDGLSANLFPLTRGEQEKYIYRLVRTEEVHGRKMYRVSFEPRPKQGDFDEHPWKGEALIDAEDYQPVQVVTRLAYKIPMAVKVLLGTNVSGLGYSVTYRKFADGVWFPVSYGGEFDVRAVFFYKRTISIAMVNSDFRRTDVTSSVAYKTDNENK